MSIDPGKATRPATIDELLEELILTEGKAEIINGRIVEMSNGFRPGDAGLNIAVSLRQHCEQSGVGKAFADGVGFVARGATGITRQSFCPDAAYYAGPLPANRMEFILQAPTIAAEVRSEGDSGDKAEQAMAEKRDEYFRAGTLVVWDVDPEGGTVTSYRAAGCVPPGRGGRRRAGRARLAGAGRRRVRRVRPDRPGRPSGLGSVLVHRGG